MSNDAVLAGLRRLGIEKSEASGHGFRATARTLIAEKLGVRSELIEHQLAHAVPDPDGRAYNRTKFHAERREMLQKWADYLDELRGDSAEGNSEQVSCHPLPTMYYSSERAMGARVAEV